MLPAPAPLPLHTAAPESAASPAPNWCGGLRLLAFWLVVCMLLGGLWRPVGYSASASFSAAPILAVPAAAPQSSLAKASDKQQRLDSKECWTLAGAQSLRASYTYTLTSPQSCTAGLTPPLRRPSSRAPPRLLSFS